jgi:taurine dioxygenase
MALKIRPIHGNFGAEVTGMAPTLRLDDETFRRIEEAWYRHSVLVFRGLAMAPEQQIAFTRRLGPLHIMDPPDYNLEGHPEIFVVSNTERDGKPVGLKRAGFGFHTDGEDKIIPNAGSLLYALEVPPEGGDTLFVCTAPTTRSQMRSSARSPASEPASAESRCTMCIIHTCCP